MENYQNVFRAKPSNYRLINHEARVYKLVYGRNPPGDLRLNYSRPKKEHRNRFWDNMIDEDVIDGLMNISKIEILDANQGHDSKLLTHLIFRPVNQDPEACQAIAGKLNSRSTKAMVAAGVGNTVTIYVSTKNWYRPHANNKELYSWWAKLPGMIKSAI